MVRKGIYDVSLSVSHLLHAAVDTRLDGACDAVDRLSSKPFLACLVFLVRQSADEVSDLMQCQRR